jgi:hypothetical protein
MEGVLFLNFSLGQTQKDPISPENDNAFDTSAQHEMWFHQRAV